MNGKEKSEEGPFVRFLKGVDRFFSRAKKHTSSIFFLREECFALSAWQPSARIRLRLSSNQNISFFVPQMLSCLHWCCYALQAFLFIKFREKRALYCFAPTNPKAKSQKKAGSPLLA